MDKKPIFTITANDVGQRLDNYLFKQRKHVKRSHWYKLMRKGQVRVNGKRVKPLYKLQSGDLVRIPPNEFFVEAKKANASIDQIEVLWQRLIFEDDNYLVFNKPSGLPCHTGTGHEFGLIEIVHSKVGYEVAQLAHRLDKDTSGCVLLAKNRKALINFQQAMKSHQISKQYLAILDGVLNHPAVVDHSLDVENRVKGIRTVVISHNGKPAQTTFTPIDANEKYTLVRCDIKYGRTHQIRVHAKHLGYPVLGDHLYGGNKLPCNRQMFLHAHVLSFDDYVFNADLPEQFKDMV